ncbi:metalloendopeptidase [Ascoidea rubescens DSM 1968]|uniref:Mitochondrial intermediate peptidase n=1 Tax=Ascoidea rubescens DSM 1968 TaxID=1344418 RepID=A0A1D2VL54_9ASCO|nr:zincin [Ascoidea rubescens DSM 1968]ODV62322.1 zincin [Ascoidea rubescens DSM 1968]
MRLTALSVRSFDVVGSPIASLVRISSQARSLSTVSRPFFSFTQCWGSSLVQRLGSKNDRNVLGTDFWRPYYKLASKDPLKTAVAFDKTVQKDIEKDGSYKLLKNIFDNEQCWLSFSKNKDYLSGLANIPNLSIFGNELRTGLFMNPYLKKPEDLEKFSDIMVTKIEKLLQKLIVKNPDDDILRNYIKDLDYLSDLLCKVIDLCSFLRVSHPNKDFLKYSNLSHQKMNELMIRLNTSFDLYTNLNDILNNPLKAHIKDSLSNEEILVGKILLKDFEDSGINLSEESKTIYIELSNKISHLEYEFISNSRDSNFKNSSNLVFNYKDLISSLPEDFINENNLLNIFSHFTFKNKIRIPTMSSISYKVLMASNNEDIRKKIYLSLYSHHDSQIKILEKILLSRKILSLKLKYNTFNHIQLKDKMSKSPENVLFFLDKLIDKVKPKCIEELKTLAEIKWLDLQNYRNSSIKVNDPSLEIFHNSFIKKSSVDQLDDSQLISFIRPWDRDYLAAKLIQQKRINLYNHGNGVNVPQILNRPISEYFSLGNVMEKLSKFLSIIYGVKFLPINPIKGETWHKDVRKVLLVDSKDENDIIGIIYFDLFERNDKSPNPAHYTIVCSRKITNPQELNECEILNDDKVPQNKNSSQGFIQCARDLNGDVYQLPIIALNCNFKQQSKVLLNSNLTQKMAFLSLSDLQTLFHEVGHSLHSMFGRTNLHNVSGTRCLTDFVELPSTLMETFAKDIRVLEFIGEHYDSKILKDFNIGPHEELHESIYLNQSENDVLKYCELYSQIKLAYIDQQLHLNTPNPIFYKDGIKSEITLKNTNLINLNNVEDLVQSITNFAKEIYWDTEKKLQIFADDESKWIGGWSHLLTYGSTYYTYTLDRAIAAKIYNELFYQNPFNTNNGHIFKNSVLKWGGSKDPWVLISDCLNDPKLKSGNKDSMDLISKSDLLEDELYHYVE